MAAIRRDRPAVAEYLIDQLNVNVSYATGLHEFRFRSPNPLRQRTFSCRDLAYEKGMMDIVDLIDITSDQVKPNIKRYLRKRVQARLDSIRQHQLKRLTEQNTRELVIQAAEDKDKKTSAKSDKDDEQPPSPPQPIVSILPPIIRPHKSRIEEAVQNIDKEERKSFDETGKKTFHFGNYNLRYRLVETTDKKKKPKEKSKLSSSIPSLPLINLDLQPSSPSAITKSNRHSISDSSLRLSMPDTYSNGRDSTRQVAIPDAASIDSKPSIPPPVKTVISSKRKTRKYINQGYVPQQQDSFYNQQQQRFVPLTLKATAIGLPSDSRIIRD